MFKRVRFIVLAISMIAIGFVGVAHPDWVIAGIPTAKASAEVKADDPCTGTETAGRCADKCPDGTYLQGYDKDNGGAICVYTSQNTCPYADAQSADSPECQKLTAEAQAQTIPANTADPAPVSLGK